MKKITKREAERARDEYIQRCFRGQYPQLYDKDKDEPANVVVPSGILHGPGNEFKNTGALLTQPPPEPTGNPDAQPLPGATMMDSELKAAQGRKAKP